MIPSQVRDGIKTALLNIPDLRAYDTIPDGLVPPGAIVGQLSYEWDVVLPVGNLDQANLDVVVIVGRMNERSAQDKLDAYLSGSGAGSIRTVLQADPTFGGTVKGSILQSANPISATVSGVEMLAYRFQMEVFG
jgi:hypothetical protein